MKNIFKTTMAFVSGLMLLASCQNEMSPLAQAVTVDKSDVQVAGQNAEAQIVKVKADGEWVAVLGADWLTVEPMSGNGNTEVKISAKDNLDSYNELNGPRSAQVSFVYGTSGIASVRVNQLGEAGLDASRTYSLIKSNDEVVAGSYLVVFQDNDTYKALASLPDAVSETRYEYAPVGVVEVSDESITEPNASKAYTFEVAEGGFYISSAGRYLFQNGTAFMATRDKAKAHVWTVSIGEDGLATITNISFSNQYIQLSTKYGTAGAYSSAQENALMPYLYKDAAAASDEVLKVAEKFEVEATATTVTIPVTSNKTWKVRNHDEWITDFTKSGEGDGNIVVTFEAYEGTEEDRVATFTVIGETTNTVVTLTQKKHVVNATMAEFVAAEKGSGPYRVTGFIKSISVSEQYGNADIVLTDGFGNEFKMYRAVDGAKGIEKLKSLKVMDMVTAVGTRDEYKEQVQMPQGCYVESSQSNKEATIAEFLAGKKGDGINYRVTGTIKSIKEVSASYGNANLTITDGTNDLYIYRLKPGYSGKKIEELGLEVGSKIMLVGTYDVYKDSPQMANGQFIQFVE